MHGWTLRDLICLDPRSVGLGGFAGEIERDRALAHVYRSVGILRWLANCNGTSGREIICSGSLRPIADFRGSCTPDVSPFADSLSWICKRQCFRVLASVMLTEAVLKNRLGLILGIEEHGRDADWFAIANLSAELLQEILETTPHVVRAYRRILIFGGLAPASRWISDPGLWKILDPEPRRGKSSSYEPKLQLRQGLHSPIAEIGIALAWEQTGGLGRRI